MDFSKPSIDFTTLQIEAEREKGEIPEDSHIHVFVADFLTDDVTKTNGNQKFSVYCYYYFLYSIHINILFVFSSFMTKELTMQSG